MPCGSEISREYSRQSTLTGHSAQICFARASRSRRSAFRSNWGGGKKTSACGPLQAALTCQISGIDCALTCAPLDGVQIVDDTVAGLPHRLSSAAGDPERCRRGTGPTTAADRSMTRWADT